MTRIHRTCFTFVLCCFVASIASATITIDTVPIGNAGNAPDPLTGHGQVNYGYRIGKYEVTAAQYIAFLNAVGGVDTNGLYDTGMSWTGLGSAITRNGAGTAANPYTYSVAPDFANRPITYVTFIRACRFVNWLQNGQPTGAQGPGTTETGTYTITTEGIADNSITRNPGSIWAITSEEEWYKAAYHKNDGATNHYFLYPTSSDQAPGRDLNDASGDNANWGGVDPEPLDGVHYATLAGQFKISPSPYGTFDQGGNLGEFNELINGPARGVRGGDFDDPASWLLSTENGFVTFGSPTAGSAFLGFRVVELPEPALAVVSGFMAMWFTNRRRIRATP